MSIYSQLTSITNKFKQYSGPSSVEKHYLLNDPPTYNIESFVGVYLIE